MTPSNELVQQMRAAAEAGSPSIVEAVRQKPATVFALISALEAMTRERDAPLMQAQIWAGEAKCHKSTVHEAYQIVTGAKGEPGNWHGAEPIKAALEAANARADAAEAKVGRLTEALKRIAEYSEDEHPEEIVAVLQKIARAALASEASS